jgi:2-amino-4-hydroxy-6-hydroxymethyldihydropteridine diphosphokinase
LTPIVFHFQSNECIYVGLGSNLGDRAGNLLLAVRGILEARFDVTRLSGIYETQPLGDVPQPTFLNMVAELSGETVHTPEQLMARLLRVEYALGRTRDIPNGPRTIDLDLLLFKDHISNSDFLTLPHPRLHKRRFVLVPLAEIAPEVIHPTLKKTVVQLLTEVGDDAGVRRWRP